MADTLIPADVKLAAKRGFVRTTFQAYAATLGAGVPSAAAILALIQDPTGWLLAGITFVLALSAPPIAGAVSYLQISSNGIPADYATKGEVEKVVFGSEEIVRP